MNLEIWVIFGLAAQSLFFLRFMVQWIASERQNKSIIPVSFWYFSIVGGIGCLIYAVHIGDPVFITGQSAGLLVYIRNLMLVRKK